MGSSPTGSAAIARRRSRTVSSLAKASPGPARSESRRILLWERADAPPLRNILEENGAKGTVAAVALAIGPEGGWTGAEFQCALKYGFREASLGRLILRTETAVIAALASVNYAFSHEEI